MTGYLLWMNAFYVLKYLFRYFFNGERFAVSIYVIFV